MGLVGYVCSRIWEKALLCPRSEIFWVWVEVEGNEEVNLHNISESRCAVHCRYLSVVLLYSLFLIVYTIGFVESFSVLVF